MTDIDRGSPTPSEGGVEPQREALDRWIALADTPFAPGGLGHEMQARGDAYLAEYVLSTDGADYEPTENERFLLSDAFARLLCDDALFGPIRTILSALASPTHQASDVSGLVEALKGMQSIFDERTGVDPLYAAGYTEALTEALAQAQQVKND